MLTTWALTLPFTVTNSCSVLTYCSVVQDLSSPEQYSHYPRSSSTFILTASPGTVEAADVIPGASVTPAQAPAAVPSTFTVMTTLAVHIAAKWSIVVGHRDASIALNWSPLLKNQVFPKRAFHSSYIFLSTLFFGSTLVLRPQHLIHSGSYETAHIIQRHPDKLGSHIQRTRTQSCHGLRDRSATCQSRCQRTFIERVYVVAVAAC